jgi:hypothetical protein
MSWHIFAVDSSDSGISGAAPFNLWMWAVNRTRASKRFLLAPLPPGWFRFAKAVVAVAVGVFAVQDWFAADRPVFPVDDAYITLHNAVALWTGHDANYVGVSALTGSTSGVHVALVALLTSVFSPLRALWASLWIATALYLLGVVRLAQAHRTNGVVLGLLLASGILTGQVPHQLMNGLETGLALAATAWAFALFAEKESARPLAFPVLLGTLPFIRPELAILSALIVGHLGYDLWRSGAPSRAFLKLAAFVTLGVAPWMILYWANTGYPGPNTMAAKQYFFAEGCMAAGHRWRAVEQNLGDFGATLSALAAAALFCLQSRTGRVQLGFAAAFIAAYYVALPGALGHYEQRYLYIHIPGLLAICAWAAGGARGRLRLKATGVLAIASIWGAMQRPERWRFHQATENFTRTELDGVASWANANLPADARVMLHDAGYFAWATRFRTYDFVGLKTPAAIPLHKQNTWATCEASRALPVPEAIRRTILARNLAIHKLAQQVRPTHLVLLHSWDSIFHFSEELRANGWNVVQLRSSAVGYEVYSLEPPSHDDVKSTPSDLR